MTYAMQRSFGAIGTPVTVGAIIDLDKSISTLLGDVNKAVSDALAKWTGSGTADANLPGLMSFQGSYMEFYGRWKAWFTRNQETWVSLSQKLLVPLLGMILSEKQDQEFGAFRGEYTTLYATWVQTLGQETDAEQTGAAPSTVPSWAFPVGAAVLLLVATGYFMSSIPFRFNMQKGWK